MTRINPMILISLLAAFALLVLVIYFSILAPSGASKPIRLVSGEWAPYTGEHLAQHGIATSIVTHVFEQLGYSPVYEFMPWQLGQSRVASSQKKKNVRGIFPYMKTEKREELFYFSESLIRIRYGVFYYTDTNSTAAAIQSSDDLSQHNLLSLEGYEYHPVFRAHMPAETCPLKDTVSGLQFLQNPRPLILIYPSDMPIKQTDFEGTAASLAPEKRLTAVSLKIPVSHSERSKRALTMYYYPTGRFTNLQFDGDITELVNADIVTIGQANQAELSSLLGKPVCQLSSIELAMQNLQYSTRSPVLIEALEVVEQLVSQRFPSYAARFGLSHFFLDVDMALMFSRANPDNLTLRDNFNRALSQLKANKNAYESVTAKVKTQIDLANSISLEPFGDEQLVVAHPFDQVSSQCRAEHSVLLPKGSKALITRWSQDFLMLSDRSQQSEDSLVAIELLTGPMSTINKHLCVDGRSIRL